MMGTDLFGNWQDWVMDNMSEQKTSPYNVLIKLEWKGSDVTRLKSIQENKSLQDPLQKIKNHAWC